MGVLESGVHHIYGHWDWLMNGWTLRYNPHSHPRHTYESKVETATPYSCQRIQRPANSPPELPACKTNSMVMVVETYCRRQ
jgi:hypothetical protein